MANYCINKLTVKGDSIQLSHFISKVKTSGNEFDLEAVYALNLSISDYPEISEEDFMVLEDEIKSNEWGTSYICDTEYEHLSDTEVIINFCSTWAPPKNWLFRVARCYGKLDFNLKYEEMGIGFKGNIKVKGNNFKETYKVFFNQIDNLYTLGKP